MAKSSPAFHILTTAASILGVSASYVPRQATPDLSFLNDEELEPSTCQALNVYWSYTGPQGTINLYATNVGLSQSTPAPSRTHSADPLPSGLVYTTTNITVTVGTNIDPSTIGFRWPSVNVPTGWYTFNASIPAQRYSAESVPFYVDTGNDTSCISNFLSPTSSVDSSNSTSYPNPVGASSQPDTITIGAIIGASFGLAIVVAALISVYVWIKRGRRGKRNCKGEYPNTTHHWKGLGSSDSRGALRGDQTYRRSNNSFGTALHSAQSDEGTGADKSSIHSKLESTTFSCEEDGALATLPVLQHQSSRSRTFAVDRPPSLSSLTTPGPSNSTHSSTPERRPSVRDTKSNRRSLDSVSYPPTRPNPTQPNRASMQLPNTDSRSSLPLGSVEAMKQANRQSFGRKRKPVPVYDEEEPSSPSVPPPLPTSPVSPSSSPLEAFLSASPTPSSIGHYVTRNHTIQESGQPDPILNGDRPVHYLIPDMPMVQH